MIMDGVSFTGSTFVDLLCFTDQIQIRSVKLNTAKRINYVDL